MCAMPVKSVYLVIGGRVQGVGYRYFVRHKADELHISGWVRNTPEGRVEIEAEGEADDLDVFIEFLKIGPARSIIQSFSASDIAPPRNFKTFAIR